MSMDTAPFERSAELFRSVFDGITPEQFELPRRPEGAKSLLPERVLLSSGSVGTSDREERAVGSERGQSDHCPSSSPTYRVMIVPTADIAAAWPVTA